MKIEDKGFILKNISVVFNSFYAFKRENIKPNVIYKYFFRDDCFITNTK